MSGNNNSHPVKTDAPPAPKLPQGLRQRSTLPLIIVAALFIIVPFFAWYGTWFGRDLSDEQITEYLSDEKKPRHVQHALSQIAERLEKKDLSVRRWYPQVVAVSGGSVAELRSDAAWLMGKDTQAEEFHAALKHLLNDPEPIVQRNAALSLVAFKDGSGLPVLRSMLEPYALKASQEGLLSSILTEKTPVKVGMMLARLKPSENQTLEVRSPLPGKIGKVIAAQGTQVKAGDTLLLLEPDSTTVWETLRALYLVGESADLPVVERYAQGAEGMPEQVKQQAELTAKAIKLRSEKSQ